MTDKDTNPSSTHPPIPTTSEDERFLELRLLRSRRVGIATFYRLLAEYGSAQNALDALPEIARAAGVSAYRICPEGVVQSELKAAKASGAQLIARGDPHYPDTLNALSDPPPFLWVIGDLSTLRRPMVSIVGARNASSLGTRMAKLLATGLGEAGYVVVSGLARGIDAAAHLAALKTGTLAVQAGGVDILYPAENAQLAEQIAPRGLRISEQPMGVQPMARHFPSRNRIIAGLGCATIVVEAATKSGSLITARDALDQGRDVLAVPGHPFDARASGCNMLIRDGATLVRSTSDVLELLGRPEAMPFAHKSVARDAPTPPTPAPPLPPRTGNLDLRHTATLHAQILSRLGPSPIAEDQLIRDLQAAAAQVAPALIDLELEGQILRQPGGLVSRVS